METKKVKIHKFWIESTSSTGVSKYKNFVTKTDYDALLKRLNSEYDRGKEDGYTKACEDHNL